MKNGFGTEEWSFEEEGKDCSHALNDSLAKVASRALSHGFCKIGW
jgi:hypothetical protein